MSLKCPACSRDIPDSKVTCDCGYNLSQGMMTALSTSSQGKRDLSTIRLLIGLGAVCIAISIGECLRMKESLIGRDSFKVAWVCFLIGLSEVLGGLLWGAVVGVGVWLTQRYLTAKSSLKPKLVALVVTTVVVSLLFIARLAGVQPEKTSTNSQPITELSSSQTDLTDRLSSSQKMRMREIIAGVLQAPDYLPPKVHAEFWAIIESNGPILPAEIQRVRDLMTDITIKSQRYFWEDAFYALKEGRPFKSIERERYETKLLSSGMVPEWRIKENEKLISKIAAKEPILYKGTTIVVTEEMITEILASIDTVGKRVEKLFTKPEVHSR